MRPAAGLHAVVSKAMKDESGRGDRPARVSPVNGGSRGADRRVLEDIRHDQQDFRVTPVGGRRRA
ncbi:hypothetical protein PCAR4_440146 [Paraburkholderia caribensis]|nr:hypothetical protein PCAR4_440146 [Paraburkholderia caribensis]